MELLCTSMSLVQFLYHNYPVFKTLFCFGTCIAMCVQDPCVITSFYCVITSFIFKNPFLINAPLNVIKS